MWPSLRRRSLRQAASMTAALGCFGLIVAAQSGLGFGMMSHRIAGESGDAVMDETTGSLGPGSLGPSGGRRAAPALSDEDRFHIYEGVMRIPDAPVVDASPPELAEALADEVPMQDLPLSVIRKLPQVEGLKFAKFDDRIVVVNPASRLVVAMIPRYKLMP
jgi:hypothetical protein